MQVILRETIDSLGHAGEIVTVRDGYGRNYLLPHGLAYPATEANKKRIAAEASQLAARDAERKGGAEALAAQVAGIDLTFTMQAGEGDKLFGSVTASDISAKLAEAGLTVEKRLIELHEPIKTVGVHKVVVRLHADVKPELRVWVVKA
ncbi:MAG: 50S ribosomal protein L9 [Gemmatimonadales bacterium]